MSRNAAVVQGLQEVVPTALHPQTRLLGGLGGIPESLVCGAPLLSWFTGLLPSSTTFADVVIKTWLAHTVTPTTKALS